MIHLIHISRILTDVISNDNEYTVEEIQSAQEFVGTIEDVFEQGIEAGNEIRK